MIRLRVREAAEEVGITSASDLARRTGVAFSTANKLWKNDLGGEGDRGIGLLTLYRVAQALGKRVDDLFEEDRRTLWSAAA